MAFTITDLSTVLIKRNPLPQCVSSANKAIVGCFLAVFATALYLTTNHYQFFTPQLLPISWLDQRVPFVPETVFIYNTEIILMISAFVLARDTYNLSRFFYSFLFLQIVSCMIFVLVPTTFPREQFPLPDDLHPFFMMLFSTLRALDTPASCAPSLHVSSCYLASFIFLLERRKLFIPYFIWATLIAISTLTTKQHYFIDVVLGLMMAIGSQYLFYRLIPVSRTPRT